MSIKSSGHAKKLLKKVIFIIYYYILYLSIISQTGVQRNLKQKRKQIILFLEFNNLHLMQMGTEKKF